MNIKKIRETAGLSKEAFAQKYGISIHTLEEWENGAMCPRYLIAYLERAVAENDMDVKLELYDANVLRELGYIYQGLLYLLNDRGSGPYPSVASSPLEYFSRIIACTAHTRVPDKLAERIRILFNCIDVDDWDNRAGTICPTKKRVHFMLGMIEYQR